MDFKWDDVKEQFIKEDNNEKQKISSLKNNFMMEEEKNGMN